MKLEVTQKNLYLLLPAKISRLAEIIAEHTDTSIPEVITSIYTTDLYRRLEQEDTKTWHLGPVALYQELCADREQ